MRVLNCGSVPPLKETFTTKLPVARNEKKTPATQGRNGNRTNLSHTRRERRTSDTFFLRSKHQCVCVCVYIYIYDIYIYIYIYIERERERERESFKKIIDLINEALI